jgi:hypothetical protein
LVREVRRTTMHRKITGKTFPSVAAVQAEVARVEALLAATQNLESSDGNMKKFMHLQVCRVELQAYLAGLLYSLGHTDLMEIGHRDAGLASDRSVVPVLDEEDLHFIQCFEC